MTFISESARRAGSSSKAIGVPFATAAKVMTGKSLRQLGFTEEIVPHFSVKVFPFLRYEGLDISLGPNKIDRQ
jgi:carbamoyl-phosphate synthase large subunit